MATKMCSGCKIEKARTEFYPRGDGTQRVQSKCKDCRAMLAGYQREWRVANPDKAKNSELKKNFGIGLDEYNSISTSQGNACAICKRPAGEIGTGARGKGSLAVDHCHTTQAIRGLLCTNCNLGLGSFFDSPELLHNAAEYLESSERLRRESKLLAVNLLQEIMDKS